MTPLTTALLVFGAAGVSSAKRYVDMSHGMHLARAAMPTCRDNFEVLSPHAGHHSHHCPAGPSQPRRPLTWWRLRLWRLRFRSSGPFYVPAPDATSGSCGADRIDCDVDTEGIVDCIVAGSN